MIVAPKYSNVRKAEKIPTEIYPDSQSASRAVAKAIAELIIRKQKTNEKAVLGLATGSTPIGVYKELIRMHQEEGLSFKNVITFNLDEYYPMPPEALQSYVRYMREHLFDHIDIEPKNIHIPDGTIEMAEVAEYCKNYELQIEAAGGLDIQLLGIGRTGHIGFNEPGSAVNSMTRLITLDKITRLDAASDFFGEEHVPARAITMGVGSIIKAQKVLLLAWGEGKAKIIKRTVEEEITSSVPATYLQEHPEVLVVLDQAAAAELTRVKTPWLLDDCDWDDTLIRKAVVWLCQKIEKPILKLTNEDYNEHGMSDLLAKKGSAYQVNIKVFNDLQHTITGWPGGKPNDDDKYRPERAKPFPKKVIIFSPHPDDDVISMGGTLIRLVEQGHEVHVAYQTSGNIAVFDDEAVRFMDFVLDFNTKMGNQDEKVRKMYLEMQSFLQKKKAGQEDLPEIQEIKGLIRRGEAKSACRYCGIADQNVHFLKMPFYETGRVKKNPISDADVKIIYDLLQEIQPHQIYAAGDLSDPHGTHRVCLSAIMQACQKLKYSTWMNDCYVWLYRGAWQEWSLEEIEMAVPISPEELLKKRRAIFKHQSQKDSPLFPGSDSREFWQRAEDRNRATAQSYDALGLAEYEAIEAFVRWIP
ncbi:MAG: glucosamine-6-phosphate deaminase [Microscillaceae bacterium]|jgi:glucosamine-6-phosphate deaminase|nr:glucosamine-6-phosphate deaminase [Microscillaceae bacterium]